MSGWGKTGFSSTLTRPDGCGFQCHPYIFIFHHKLFVGLYSPRKSCWAIGRGGSSWTHCSCSRSRYQLYCFTNTPCGPVVPIPDWQTLLSYTDFELASECIFKVLVLTLQTYMAWSQATCGTVCFALGFDCSEFIKRIAALKFDKSTDGLRKRNLLNLGPFADFLN